MRKITFEEAIILMKTGETVLFGKNKQEVNIKSEIADIGYEITFNELINDEWFTKDK